jgi:hypothetical protein
VFANTIAALPSNIYTPATFRIEAVADGILNISGGVVGDRLLIKNEVEARANGVYDIIDVGSASTKWVLIRSADADNSPNSEIASGNVLTSLNPTIAQYVLTGGPGTRIINDPVLNNNSVLSYSLFGSSIPPNLSVATIDTSGTIVAQGALSTFGAFTVNGTHATNLGGTLTVTGVSTFGEIGSIGSLPNTQINGTVAVTGTTRLSGAVTIDSDAAFTMDNGAITTGSGLVTHNGSVYVVYLRSHQGVATLGVSQITSVDGNHSSINGSFVSTNGGLSCGGTKAFKIHHPLEPATKNLNHACIESPEALNIYRGHVQLDVIGVCVVNLPSYYWALNGHLADDTQYQLTSKGSAQPNLHISLDVDSTNTFTIAGGVSNGHVWWQVTGRRNDSQLGTVKVEYDKTQEEMDKYALEHP